MRLHTAVQRTCARNAGRRGRRLRSRPAARTYDYKVVTLKLLNENRMIVVPCSMVGFQTAFLERPRLFRLTNLLTAVRTRGLTDDTN